MAKNPRAKYITLNVYWRSQHGDAIKSICIVKNILHEIIVVEYFGTEKLHQINLTKYITNQNIFILSDNTITK